MGKIKNSFGRSLLIDFFGDSNALNIPGKRVNFLTQKQFSILMLPNLLFYNQIF